MAALLSSPMMSTLHSGHNLHDELADQSFGSSMSLGSSFELNKLAASGVVIGGNGFKTGQGSGNIAQPSFQAVRQSPNGKQYEGLGAAMGTLLNRKSPGLAAKMSTSPQYMDLSPRPTNVTGVRKARSNTSFHQLEAPKPLDISKQREGVENLPPGSAMKEDTLPSETNDVSVAQRRHHSDYSGVNKGGSLGRLFGTELSMLANGSSTSNGHRAVRTSVRCQSASFQLAGVSLLAAPKSSDMSMSSADASGSAADCSIEDASPSIGRNVRQYATISGSTKFHLPPGFDASGSPIAPSSRSSLRPGMLRRPSKDDSSPLRYGKRFAAATLTAASVNPILGCPPHGFGGESLSANGTAASGGLDQHMPGFGASEREGKILPCFNVKDDGLMRITPDTLLQVLQGKFDEHMDGFQIVDCRFAYEFDGGHVPGAINLSTLDKVKRHFLQPVDSSTLPARSQSGKAGADGNTRKKVIIFHCEFSAKRAPSSALALRQADRALAHDYPNCHYPEVYILQGGYCAFYKLFADVCQPKAYVQMDDPRYVQRRSIELNGFRKQFARHKSFAYGDSKCGQTQSDGQLVKRTEPDRIVNGSKTRLLSALGRSIKEEDSSTSFDSSASSPCAVQADAVMARRRGMTRHATSASVLGSGSGLAFQPAGGMQQFRSSTTTTASNTLGFRPILTRRDEDKPEPTCIGDLSFGSSCSIADDSFDAEQGAISESPCAAMTATGRRTYSRLTQAPR